MSVEQAPQLSHRTLTPPMELRHLRYFVAVAEEQHFGRAALRLDVSQPTLSRQVRELEEELGFPLLERLPRGVRPLPAGVVFLAEARETLQHADAAVRRAAAANRGEEGVLRIGHVDVGLDAEHLIRVLSDFRSRFPAVQLELTLMSSMDQLAALRSGTLDVAIVYSGGPQADGLTFEWLTRTPLDGVLLSRDSELAAIEPLSLAHLADLPMLMFPREMNTLLHDVLVDGLRLRGMRSQVLDAISKPVARGMAVTPLLLAAVAAGQGWLPTNRRTAESYHAWPNVVYRAFVEPPVPFGVCLAVRRREDSRSVCDFLALARAGMDHERDARAPGLSTAWAGERDPGAQHGP